MQLDILCLFVGLLFRLVDCSDYDPIKHATWYIYDSVDDIIHYPSRLPDDEDKKKLLKVTEWKPNDPLGGFVPSTGKIICEVHPRHNLEENTHFLKVCHDAGRRIAEVVSIRENIKLLFTFKEHLRHKQTIATTKVGTYIPVLDLGNEIRYYPQPLVKNMFFPWEHESLQAPYMEYDGSIFLNLEYHWNNPDFYQQHIVFLMHEMIHTLGFHRLWPSGDQKEISEDSFLAPPFSRTTVEVESNKVLSSQHYDSPYGKFLKFKMGDNWITTTEVTRILNNRWGNEAKHWRNTSKGEKSFPLQIAIDFHSATTKKGNVVFNSNLYNGREIAMHPPDISHVEDLNADYLMNSIIDPDEITELSERYPTGLIGPKVRAILGAMGYGIAGLKGVGAVAVEDDMKIIPPRPITSTKESQDDDDEEVSIRLYPGSKLEVVENHFPPFNRYHRDHFLFKSIEHGIRKTELNEKTQ